MTRREAFYLAFERAARCGSVGDSGFQCQYKVWHDGNHFADVAGARRSWR